MAYPVISLVDMGDDSKKCFSVRVVFEDGFLFIAARGNVVYGTGIFYAKWTCHEVNIAYLWCNGKKVDLTP
jgi:hypothetical protein